MKKRNVDVIRAWKDPAYRATLSNEDRSALPDNPAGAMDVSDAELGHIEGGFQFARYAAVNALAVAQFNPSAVDACPSSLGCTWDIGRVAVINPEPFMNHKQLFTQGF